MMVCSDPFTMEEEAHDETFSVQGQEVKDFRDCFRDAHEIRRDQRNGRDDHIPST
jgi:hypothetical protein